jgi:predicted O-linked N-acetylglucosamine transferase (SPINDLY family)
MRQPADALFAGLPVLTCKGTTFAGRVAASLLHAAGLPELVTDSLEAYEAGALKTRARPVAADFVQNSARRTTRRWFSLRQHTRSRGIWKSVYLAISEGTKRSA